MYFHFQNFPVHVTFTLTTIKATATKVPLLIVYRKVHSISIQFCIYFCTQHIDCTAQNILTLRTKHQRSHNDLNYHSPSLLFMENPLCQRNKHNKTFSWTDFKGHMANKHLNKYLNNNSELPHKVVALSISQHCYNKRLLKHVL